MKKLLNVLVAINVISMIAFIWAWIEGLELLFVISSLAIFFVFGLLMVKVGQAKEDDLAEYPLSINYEENQSPHILYLMRINKLLGPGQQYLFSIKDVRLISNENKEPVEYEFKIKGPLNHLKRLQQADAR
jgi:hypothetical protein